MGALPGDDQSQAGGVNNNGDVVGASRNISASVYTPFLWTSTGGMQSLGGLGGRSSFAAGIDDSGAVYGSGLLTGDLVVHAFRWTSATGLVDIGSLGGGSISVLRVYSWGGVIGDGTTATGADHAFTWDTTNGLQDIGTLGGSYSSPLAMSARGEIIGISQNSAGAYRDFYWTRATGMVDIGDPSTLQVSSINASGQMAGAVKASDGAFHPALITLQTGPQDSDGDGVADSIDTGAGTFADSSLTPPTTGSIVSTGGNTVFVADAPSPDGVRITVSGSGSTNSVVNVCGFAALRLAPGADVVVTCGSVKVQVVSGGAKVVLDSGITTVSVPQGDTAKVTDLGNGSFSVANLAGTAPVTVTTNGTTSTVTPGGTSTIAVLTPANLCLLTKTDVQGSSKYAALTPKQKQAVDAIAQSACNQIAQITPKLTPKQKAVLVAAYKVVVDVLASQGWLTATQSTDLKALAGKL